MRRCSLVRVGTSVILSLAIGRTVIDRRNQYEQQVRWKEHLLLRLRPRTVLDC